MTDQKYLINHYKRLFDIEKKDIRNANLRKIVIAQLKSGSVVDIGSGTGLLASEVFLSGYKKVLTVDIEDELLTMVQKNASDLGAKLETKKLAIEDLKKIGRNKFDNLICLDVIEHIENDSLGLENFNYILKKGGRLIINVPAFSFLFGRRDVAMGHLRRYSKSMLEELVKKAGFKIKTIKYWNFLGFWIYLIFEKILGKRVNEKVRYKPKGFWQNLLNRVIFWWMQNIENKYTFPFGLSVFLVAEKI